MPHWLQGNPVWVIFVVLFLGALGRGQATYWLARAACEQGVIKHGHRRWQIRARTVLNSESVHYGRRFVDRWGLAAIPLCYLTVGLQSLVLAGAGVLRIRWVRFSLAQLLGALTWAGIYTTIGWAMWQAAFSTAARSPWALGAVAAGSVVAVCTWRLRRRNNTARAQVGLPALSGKPTTTRPATTTPLARPSR